MNRMILLALALSTTGCETASEPSPSQDAFFDRLSALCGKAFLGRIASPVVEADADFADKPLIMHVRECSEDAIRIPFHVGEDRSRTWVVSRTGAGVRLKHDHRHADGSEDELTQYGGDTAVSGTVSRQEFPADQFSKDMFVAQGLPQSVPNVWAMEVEPGRLFAYELKRPDRFFRVDFDLTTMVQPPPPPWGS